MSNYWCCSADFGKHDVTCKNYKGENMKCSRCGDELIIDTCISCLKKDMGYKICNKCGRYSGHYPKDDVCKFCKKDKKYATYKNYKEVQTDKLVKALDNSKIGRFGFNKSTIIIDNKEDVCITVYDANNQKDEFDEQLTFKPEELLEFCREVIRISEQS